MCTEAIVDGKTVSNQGELAEALGGVERLAYLPDYLDGARDLKVCLCPIDFDAIAKATDMDILWHDWSGDWMGEVELTSKKAL